ncbi:unnamed protein product [Cuscuta campestris]|uniref:Uncharacterized protein n=1 Tax=Cuscuta campestris TaxID=132261 RepID=A0A484ME35_9ASTE|nr:unnamed protein product [Cuscuta campestris]
MHLPWQNLLAESVLKHIPDSALQRVQPLLQRAKDDPNLVHYFPHLSLLLLTQRKATNIFLNLMNLILIARKHFSCPSSLLRQQKKRILYRKPIVTPVLGSQRSAGNNLSHTKGHIGYYVTDKEADEPAVFTGDTLKMDCDAGKEPGEGGEKRSGSPVVADPASKKPRSEPVEESIVETEEPIAEIDKNSFVEIGEEPKIHFRDLAGKEDEHIIQTINGIAEIYKLVETDEDPKIQFRVFDEKEGEHIIERMAENDKESVVELVEKPIAEVDEASIIVATNEEPKVHFRMLAKKGMCGALQRMHERLIMERGLRWILYRFMVGEDDEEKFKSLVESLKDDYNEEKNSLIEYFEGPPKFVMVAVEANTLDAKRVAGYPSCDKSQEDMIVDVVGKRHDVCTTLVGMILCVYEDFRYDKRGVHSMEMRMRNLPFSGLPHEVYIYGRKQMVMGSYEDGKEKMSLDYLFLGKPFLLVFFPLHYAQLLTLEEGKFIDSIRGPSVADYEVTLTDCGSGLVKFSIFGKSMSEVIDAMKTFVEKLKSMGDIKALELAAIVEKGQYNGMGGSYFVGCWLSDNEYDDDDDECWC